MAEWPKEAGTQGQPVFEKRSLKFKDLYVKFRHCAGIRQSARMGRVLRGEFIDSLKG
jgi:hypothetical protein